MSDPQITEEMIEAGAQAMRRQGVVNWHDNVPAFITDCDGDGDGVNSRIDAWIPPERVVRAVLEAALTGRTVLDPAPRDQVWQTVADVRDAFDRSPRDVDTEVIIDALVAGGFLVLAAEETLLDWCNCQAVRGTANYPGPWHPKGDPTGCLKHGAVAAGGEPRAK